MKAKEYCIKKGEHKMEIIKALLTPNMYSRPQTALKKVTHIVIHWVGNANSTAKANCNYFESLKTKKIYASAHYIIGLEGEILQCIPETEIAYHAKEANSYSLGIENCHPDWSGKFNNKTYASLIALCADICIRYGLEPEKALLRHYDVTKKLCPKYYVDNPKAWDKLKKDVRLAMNVALIDSELLEALDTLIASGIVLDRRVWGDAATMKMEYARPMVERIGHKFGKKTYKDTIDFLVSKGCITVRSVWDTENFKPQWCRALIINVYRILIMPNK